MESGGKVKASVAKKSTDHSYAKRNGNPLNEGQDCRGNFTMTEHLKRHIKNEHMSDINNLACASEYPTKTPENSMELDDVEIGGKGEIYAGIKVFPDRLLKYQMHTDVGKTPNHCPVCGLSFRDKKTLSLHKCQTKKKEFVCGFCGSPYKYIAGLRTHVLSKHINSQLFWCKRCGNNFKYKRDLEIHVLNMHTDTRLFICKNPAETPENSVEKDDYVEIGGNGENEAVISVVKSANDTEANIVLFKCLRCDESFKSMTELSVHSVSHQEDAVYKCVKCGLIFTHLSLLTNHFNEAHGKVSLDSLLEGTDGFNIHLGKTPNDCLSIPSGKYYCGDCGLPYKTFHRLRSHMLSQHKKSIFWCEKCCNDFKSSSDLELHILRMHTDTYTDSRPFVCEKCRKSFTLLTTLKEHEFTHSAVQAHKCTDLVCECHYCGKLFTTENLQRTHLKSHCECTPQKNYLKPEDWPFKCEECECRFRYFYELKLHTSQLHPELKPFKCDECEKCFASQVILNLHMKTHTTVEPFNSSSSVRECNFGHSQSNNSAVLSGNNVTHQQEAAFRCAKCDIFFSQQSLLNNHYNQEHSHECPQCGIQFLKSCLLEDHMNTHLHNCTNRDCACKNETNLSGNHTKTPKVTVENNLRSLKDIHSTEKEKELPVAKPENDVELEKAQSILTTHLTSESTICPTCFIQFSRLEDMQSHQLRVHRKTYGVVLNPHEHRKINEKMQEQGKIHRERQKLCSDCGETFTTRNLLQKHRKLHNAKWPCTCGMCDSRFKHTYELKMHKLGVHTDEEPFKCSECGKCFASVQILKSHMKTHLASKCSHIGCNCAFYTLRQLNQHREIISRSQLDELDNSEAAVDSSEQYPCLYCKERFVTFSEAQTHITSHGELNLIPVQMKSELNMSNEDSNSSGSDTDSKMDADTDISKDSDIIMEKHITDPIDCFHSVSADERNSMDCKKEDSKPFPCLKYNACDSTNSDLEAHKKVQNDSESTKDYDYLHHFKYKSSMDFDDDLKPFPCLACHKSFTSNLDLEAHLKTHIHVNSKYLCVVNGALNWTDDDSAKCDMPSKFKDPIEMHNDETPHYNSDLGIQMKTHINVKSEDSCFVNGELNVRF